VAFTVVLDTCVLYPAHLRDTLLRLAEQGFYRALWSGEIVGELRRNLTEAGIAAESVDHLLAEMNDAFPDATTTGYRSLVEAMTCDPKDRHVLAAAVRAADPATAITAARWGVMRAGGTSARANPVCAAGAESQAPDRMVMRSIEPTGHIT